MERFIILYSILIQQFSDASINDLILPEEQDLEGVPKFLVQPKEFYYIKSDQTVTVSCIADPVSHANIICAGKQFSYMGRTISDTGLIVTKLNKNNQIDPQGNRWNISLIVEYKSVSEWFSKFECVCEAWNQILALGKAKKILSKSSVILESYFHSNFHKIPLSQNLLINQKLELHCVPPDAKPTAFVTWWKNNRKISESSIPHIKIIDETFLLIENVTEADKGRYCCDAQSLDIIRRSPCAEINLNDSHNWSSWSFCDNLCVSYRTRGCQINQCQFPDIQYKNCSSYSCWNMGNVIDQFENVIYISLSILVFVLFVIFLAVVFAFRRKNLLNKSRDQNNKSKTTKIPAEQIDENMYTCHSISSSTDCMIDENHSIPNSNPLPISNRNKIQSIESETLVPYSAINSDNVDMGTYCHSSCLSTEGRSFISKDVGLSIFNSSSSSSTQTPINNLFVYDDSVYNVLTSRSNNSFDGMAWGTFSSIGGHLDIPESGVSLFISRGAIPIGLSQRIFLTVSRCSAHKPILNDNETLLSPIVICGPEFVDFEKFVILTVPHNAVIAYSQWHIKLLHSKYANNSEKSNWEILSVTNNDDYGQQVYVHLMREKACIILKSLGMYCLIGQPHLNNSNKASISIKIIVFSNSVLQETNQYSIRVYTIPNTKEAFESVYFAESKSGGKLLNCSQTLNFLENDENLILRINEINKGWKIQQTPQTQLVKFPLVWKSHDSLGIMNRFIFENSDPNPTSFSCSLVAYQNGNYSNRVTLELKNGKCLNQTEFTLQKSMDKISHKETAAYPFVHPIFENYSLSSQTKKDLSKLLNVYDPSGNDWRLLAREMKIIKTDFFLKGDPTDNLLNLWQAQSPQKSYIKDLMTIFQRYKRFDCVTILERNEGYRL